MLVRQYQFPDTYDDELDVVLSMSMNQMLTQDPSRTTACLQEHAGTTPFISWVRSVATADEVLAFMQEVMDVYELYPLMDWTGFRVLSFVGRDGAEQWFLQLFAKDPDTDTAVYTGEAAPNVGRSRD